MMLKHYPSNGWGSSPYNTIILKNSSWGSLKNNEYWFWQVPTAIERPKAYDTATQYKIQLGEKAIELGKAYFEDKTISILKDRAGVRYGNIGEEFVELDQRWWRIVGKQQGVWVPDGDGKGMHFTKQGEYIEL